MTAEERSRAVKRGAVTGLILAGFFAVFLFLGIAIGKWFCDSLLTGVIIILPLALILMGIAWWKLTPLTDQYWKYFLASTQWSAEQGLTSDKIVLRRS